MSHWALPLIGQPWTPERNCWWLVRHVFSEQLRIDLPLLNVSDADPAAMRAASDVSGWKHQKDTGAQEWDVLLMQGPTGRHIGVMITANRRLGLLHNMEETGVIFQTLGEVKSMGYRDFEVWRHA